MYDQTKRCKLALLGPSRILGGLEFGRNVRPAFCNLLLLGEFVELVVPLKMIFIIDFISLHLPEGVSCVKLHFPFFPHEILDSLVAYCQVTGTL